MLYLFGRIMSEYCLSKEMFTMLKPNKTLRTFLSIMGGLMLLLSLFLPAQGASALGATSSTLPIFFLRSADCTGEIVQISGTIHLVSVIQPDGSIVSHFNYQNVTGLGLTSGSTYRVTAVDQVRLSAPFPS